MSLGVIIVAAGSSRRMGFDKLMQPLDHIPVLQRTLNTFQNHPLVKSIVIVTPEIRFDTLEYNKIVSRADGGIERHISVINGLEKLSPEISHVAIHDGARPLISIEQINKVLAAAKDNRAATSAKKITDTIKRSDNQELTKESISRENLWAMETPQIFDLELLKQAYKAVLKDNILVTDEVSAVEHIGVKTKLVHNSTPNPKITFPEDIFLAEHLLKL